MLLLLEKPLYKLCVTSTGHRSFENILLSNITPRCIVHGKRRKIDINAYVIIFGDFIKQIKEEKKIRMFLKRKEKKTSLKNILPEESENYHSDLSTDISLSSIFNATNAAEKSVLQKNQKSTEALKKKKNVIKILLVTNYLLFIMKLHIILAKY